MPALTSTPLCVLAIQDAEKEDYEEKLKEVQDICGPIISKVRGPGQQVVC